MIEILDMRRQTWLFRVPNLDRNGHHHGSRPIGALDQLDALDRVFLLGLDAR